MVEIEKLVGVETVACVLGLEEATVRNHRSRKSRENNSGFPKPVMTRPLRWSPSAINDWIIRKKDQIAPLDEKQLWQLKIREANAKGVSA